MRNRRACPTARQTKVPRKTSSLSRESVSGAVGDPILVKARLHAEVEVPHKLGGILPHVELEAIEPALPPPPLKLRSSPKLLRHGGGKIG